MKPLSRSQRRLLELRLRAREQEIRAGIRRRVEDGAASYASLNGSAHDQGDEALADLAAEIDRAVNASEAAELEAIAVAHVRLANGRYGFCANCGEPIGYERLLAQPTAMRCIRCQTRHEHMFAGQAHSSI
ncbi:TraR/DksA family transcriptional regulator [Caballeronia sp. SL2Y3]|uniref:TraR/DksA family transcriptional regulator n=1 Tax=Caballeronia sp. SL2Y3 TaxID=2878151 RepID=UPI001FD4AE6E|nr:TraR/DksA family transcriptional regulator [Caballeronia sp. SL2Y3]